MQFIINKNNINKVLNKICLAPYIQRKEKEVKQFNKKIF